MTMNVFREIPPTAGFSLAIKDFISLRKQDSSFYSLEDDFKRYLNTDFARITYSGTAACYLILEALKELSSKRTVVIPAFICPLIPLAIKRAGLNVEVCDINHCDFNFDLNELENICRLRDDILALIPVHLAGIPVNMEPLKRIAQRYKIFIIEDCAQSLGALYRGSQTGMLGDFGFFSLCRGKGPTIYEGGVVVAGNENYSGIIDKKIRELVKNNYLSEGLKIMELIGYWIFYRPQLFWFVFRLPQLFWNFKGRPLKALQEDFTIGFPIHRVSKFRQRIGHAGFLRLEKEISEQRKKAEFYLRALQDVSGITVVREPEYCRATYPYLTVIFDEPDTRERALKRFENSGLGVSLIYAFAINDYEYLKDVVPEKDCPHARSLAAREITLSTNRFMSPQDLEKVVTILSLR